MCLVHVAGLIGPGDRKSVQPMAARAVGVGYDQLHHFIASGVWDAAPLEAELLTQADAMVGGDEAWLIVDDTALPKKGDRSVEVAPQYASALGKNANRQTLASLTLASGKVPVMAALRPFPPENWTSDPQRLARAKIPQARQAYRSKERAQHLRCVRRQSIRPLLLKAVIAASPSRIAVKMPLTIGGAQDRCIGGAHGFAQGGPAVVHG
jgi:hypothetical protein